MNVKKTREAILDNSIIIFNEKKPSKVSTVQIADQMGISPGNLYYYFGNKEEIIRCIWRERILKDIQSNSIEFDSINSGGDIVKIFRSTIDHIRNYKFFYSEISTLLNNDNILRDDMKCSIEENQKKLFSFIRYLIERGLMKQLTTEEMIRAADSICAISGKAFYSNYAYSFYSEAGDDIVDVLLINIVRGIKPYLTDGCWKGIIAELNASGISYEKVTELLDKNYIRAE